MLAWSLTMNHCKSLERPKKFLGKQKKKKEKLYPNASLLRVLHCSHESCAVQLPSQRWTVTRLCLGDHQSFDFCKDNPTDEEAMVIYPLNLAEECAAAKSGQAHTDTGFPKAAGKSEEAKREEDLWHREGPPCANHGSQDLLAVYPSQPAEYGVPSSPRKANWAPATVPGFSQLLNRVMFQLPSSLKHPTFVFLEWKV